MEKTEIYDSSNKMPLIIREVKEIVQYHYLIEQLVRRDIVTRYKRSYLGIAWSMLNPLGIMIVMTVVFSHLFGSTPGYPVYVLSGLLAWNFFSKSTSAAMNNMVWGGGLLKRIYLPRSSFCLSSIGTEIVNLLLSLVPMALVMLVTRFSFHLSLIFLPVSILLMAAFSLGVSLCLSTFALLFPDVAEMYQIILTAWMYLTPIIYPISTFPEQYRWLLKLNPLLFFTELFHIPIYEGRFPAWAEFWPALVIAIVMLIIGWAFFSKKIDEFSYRV
jgi:ABC-type polysaccharide/polyol phosphate export permease